MESKIISLQKLDGIYDIQPIVSPPMSAFEFTVLSILTILFLALTIYLVWLFKFSQKAKSRREIIKLQKQLKHNVIDPHDAVYELCKIFRKGIEKKQLDSKTPLPKNSKGSEKRWHIFINELSYYRYKKRSASSIDISKLLDESIYWLQG